VAGWFGWLNVWLFGLFGWIDVGLILLATGQVVWFVWLCWPDKWIVVCCI